MLERHKRCLAKDPQTNSTGFFGLAKDVQSGEIAIYYNKGHEEIEWDIYHSQSMKDNERIWKCHIQSVRNAIEGIDGIRVIVN